MYLLASHVNDASHRRIAPSSGTQNLVFALSRTTMQHQQHLPHPSGLLANCPEQKARHKAACLEKEVADDVLSSQKSKNNKERETPSFQDPAKFLPPTRSLPKILLQLFRRSHHHFSSSPFHRIPTASICHHLAYQDLFSSSTFFSFWQRAHLLFPSILPTDPTTPR